MAGTGLRARKKEETRLALRSASLRLTAEHGPGGLERVTVEDIAAAAGVSARTFFNYFSSKEEAIVGVESEGLAELVAALAARPLDEEPLFSLQAVLHGIAISLGNAREEHVMRAQVLADNPGLLPRQVAAYIDFERTLVEEIRRRTKTRKGSDADADIALVVAAAVVALRVSAVLWIAGGGRAELPELLDRAIDRLAAGLVPPGAGPKPRSKARAKAPPTRKPVRKDPR